MCPCGVWQERLQLVGDRPTGTHENDEYCIKTFGLVRSPLALGLRELPRPRHGDEAVGLRDDTPERVVSVET
ncbi:MAG: hypothetical protein M3322_07825 [Actinomycetota bacterium]|nr:hypothetical protein [Actinomycetota bacterium]